MNSRKEVHTFIDLVDYYRDMWARLSRNIKLICTDIEQKLFEQINLIMDYNTLLAYPGFIK